MPAFNSEVAEMASELALQAPGMDAPLDELGDWGREVVRFLTWLNTEERKVLFTLTAVSELQTTFQDQVDARRHHPWRSWGRRWLPLTNKAWDAKVDAWEAKMQGLMMSPVIEDPLATQFSSAAVVILPEPCNNDKGSGRAAAPAAAHLQQDSTDSAVTGTGDGKTDKKPPARCARTSQAKHSREEVLQVDARPSDVQTSSSIADHPSNRPRLSPSVKKPAAPHPRMPPPKRRSVNEIMQEHHLRDPCAVVLECQRCTDKPSAKRPCLTVLRLCRQTDEYELSDRCMRCIMDHRKCEWPAGAISKNAEHRMHFSTKRFSNTEDQFVAPKLLGPTLTQSSGSIPQVVINSPHKNTVKATSSGRPAPGPSSATATKQAKHTSPIVARPPTPNPSLRSTSPISTEIMELL
ncbi:hypothetical protein F4604DRAFT_1684846 [Suillus subluteus]|nr:hypothetical protein F4604DRAFT_1684846 [Suillus subluteus]